MTRNCAIVSPGVSVLYWPQSKADIKTPVDKSGSTALNRGGSRNPVFPSQEDYL